MLYSTVSRHLSCFPFVAHFRSLHDTNMLRKTSNCISISGLLTAISLTKRFIVAGVWWARRVRTSNLKSSNWEVSWRRQDGELRADQRLSARSLRGAIVKMPGVWFLVYVS